MSSKAVVHVRTVRHKLNSENIIGFRLEAAIPNLEGRVMRRLKDGDFYATQQVAPSFRKPYFVLESSDHTNVGPKQISKFLDDLRWQGFNDFDFIGKCGGESFAEVAAGL
jgi:hypothetical protein